MRLLPLRLGIMLLAVAGSVRTQTPAPACTGLCLQQVSCPSGTSTTITGTVYAPNGTDPIPNVTVYIPNSAVSTLPAGVSCPVPGQLPSGSPLVGTFSAADGTFTLANAPVGTNIPLVIVAGKWRRQVTVPGTVACANTAFNARFPRNQSEGDIPQFAVSTGSQDQVECVLRKIGIDDAEFTNPGGGGRIQLYSSTLMPGAQIDAATPSANKLMGDLPTLNSYDVLMLPCEGAQHTKPAAQLSNLVSYTNAGGRVYGSHFAYEWLWHNPPFDTVATWTGSNGSLASGNATVDQSFASGATLAQWLQLVGASTTLGQIGLETIKFDTSGVNPPTQVWLNLNATGNPIMQFTFDTPVGATSGQCGRVLFNEYHVESNGNSRGKVFPTECSNASTTPQEKLLEYSLFDLSNNGGPATMAPATAAFGDQVVGFPSAAKLFTVTNNSVFNGALTSLSATDDFQIASNTCTSVAAGGPCTIGVVFKPSTLGAHTGSLKLVFAGTTLTAALTGNGIPALTLQAGAVDFGSTDVTTTVSRNLLLTNNAPAAVALPAFTLTGDYLLANRCSATLAAGATCALTLNFTPTVYGPRPGTLQATGAAANLAATLTGNGLDFATAILPASGAVIAGLSTTPSATATPLGGFAAPVTLTCTATTPGMSCGMVPVPSTPADSTTATPATSLTVTLASQTQFNLTVATTSQYTLVGYGVHGSRWLLGMSLVSGLGLLLVRRRGMLGGRLPSMLGALLLFVMVGLSGCSGKLPSLNPVFTPPGTYTVQLSATDGILTRTATYSLKVTAK